VSEYQAIVSQAILNQATFVRAVFSGFQRGATVPYTRVVLRPIEVKGQAVVQFAYFDAKKCITKNYRDAELTANLNALLELPFRNLHVTTADEEIQVQITKDGKPLVHRKKAAQPRAVIPLAHDRQKDILLPEGTPDPYLQAIGFMTEDGRIRADKQKKFKQINEFLKLVQQTGILEKLEKPEIHVVDFGCGNAYLTFAVYHYLNHILGRPARLTGVDVRGELLQKHAETARSLGWQNIRFEEKTIADYQPETSPDIVLALHACDTATDEALAQGIRNQAPLIISVPCCHHHLQVQLEKATTPEPFRPVARHGILAERMGDVLTDAFRAQILRLEGYQTDVIQFISSEHTAKNLMIRAVNVHLSPTPALQQEYAALKEYWHVTPYLETLLENSNT
jgi:SAM-dependent methyltransferase